MAQKALQIQTHKYTKNKPKEAATCTNKTAKQNKRYTEWLKQRKKVQGLPHFPLSAMIYKKGWLKTKVAKKIDHVNHILYLWVRNWNQKTTNNNKVRVIQQIFMLDPPK